MTAGFAGASPGSTPYDGEPGTRLTTLANGLRILTSRRRETKAVAINLAVLAGSRDEDSVTAGAAHMMEHFFFQGTARSPSPDDLVAPITARGGIFNAATERETIGFFIEAPATATDVALVQLGDVIVNAQFDDARLENVRSAVIGELRKRWNDPAQTAMDVFHDLALEGHPACHSPGGSPENVRAIDLDTLRRYRGERFRGGNMVLAVVGNVQHETVVQAADRTLSALPSGSTPRAHVPLPDRSAARLERAGGRTSAHLVVGWTVPGANASERFPLTILASVLGGAGRRLRRALREERALTYSVSARFGALSDIGVFSIATTAEPDRVDDVLDVIHAELRHVASGGVSPAELGMAQGYIEGRTYLGEERNLAQARRLSGQELLGSPMTLDAYVNATNAVTLDQLQSVAQTYLVADRALTVVVKP